MSVAIEIVFILILIVLNGMFAMSELALVSARRARLLVMESNGARGAGLARQLADDPQRFFPTVQVGITLVGILAGVFGGARSRRTSPRGSAGIRPLRLSPSPRRSPSSWSSSPI